MSVTERTPVQGQPREGRPAGRRLARALPVVASVLALALVGLSARMLAEYQWDRVVEYESPYVVNAPPGDPTPPLADRVVMVVVDGLRVDTARELSTFQRLAGEGSFTIARTAEPSLSLPGWTYLVTGAPPDVSGVTTNWYEGRVRVDSLFASAAGEGMRSAIAGHSAWEPMFGHQVYEGNYGAGDDANSDLAVAAEAMRLLVEVDPAILLVHLPDVDNVGHAEGVHEGYDAVATRADALIADLVEVAGPETTFVLTSDHGHVDAGGHGGPERVVTEIPVVMAGPGIAPGASGEYSMGEIAPTVAALLGLPRPGHATEQVRESLLAGDAEAMEEIRHAHGDASREFFAQAAAAIGREATDAGSFEQARQEKQRRDFTIRILMILPLLLLAGLVVRRFTRRLDARAMAAGVIAFFAAWAAQFFGRGLTFSFSHFNTEDQIEAFLLARLVDAVIAGLIAGAVAGVVVGRRRSGAAYRTGLGAAAWILVCLAVPVGAFLAVYGWAFNWMLPNLSMAFGEYLALLAILGVGLTAWVAALVSVGAAGLAGGRRAAP